MKKRKLFILLAAVTAGSLLLNGCGLDLTSKEDTTLSAEMENENLSDGMIRLHSSWYDAEGSALASAVITFTDGRDEVFSGTTAENGDLELCSLPGNTTLKCTITDSAGETIGQSDIVLKISADYTAITIYPVHGDNDSEHIIEFPADKTEVRAAVFLTENKTVSFANVSPYVEPADSETDTEEGSDTEGADANTADTGTDTEGADTNAGADANAGDAANTGDDTNAGDAANTGDDTNAGDAATQ